MANVSNYLLVEGKQAEIDQFFSRARGHSSLFDFESLVPIPSRLLVDPYGSLGQHKLQDWAVQNWGVKYNCFDSEVRSPHASFRTAWNVPYAFLTEISFQFPSLLFTNNWFEDRLNSAGTIVLLGGIFRRNKMEHFSQWQQCKSKYIHPLNLEHNLENYKAYLRSAIDATDNDIESQPFRYYLDLIEKAKS